MFRKRRIMGLLFLAAVLLSLFPASGSAKERQVYVVPLEHTVENGLFAFIDRALSEAEEQNADLVIFEIDTPGGLVDAAGKIAKRMAETSVETAAFVNNEALSAGAYIALNTDKIYMVPNATIGSAAVIDSIGNAADQKAQSYWSAAMRTSAEQNGREPVFAEAMADESIDLPEYGAGKGKLLTFTASQALKAGYSEGTVSSLDELLDRLGYGDAQVRHIDESFPEKLARWLTSPYIIPILFTVAMICIVIELFSPGFGVPGILGILALMLYFYGHLVAGLTGYETVALFVIGLILCLLELFVPGGIIGFLGLAAILSSLFLASDHPVTVAVSLLIAAAVAVTVAILMIRVYGKQMNFFRKMILTDSTDTKSGYVSNKTRHELLGSSGITLTDLRPAGTAVINDERLDVVSEGSFIPKETKVIVVKAEGARIVVREA